MIGVLAGFWAALFQSLSYVGSRHFMSQRPGSTRRLLVLSHLWMGGACLVVLPFVWPSGGVPWRDLIAPLAGTAGFYLLGQFGLLLALRGSAPSQVAPMLVLKIFMLAIMTVAIKHEPILSAQWAAVLSCVAGTFVLNYHRGDRMPRSTVLALVFTCVFYSLSDWSIGYLVPSFGAMPQWQAITCASLLSYLACGVAAVPFIPWYGSRKLADWRDSLPYSAAWLLGAFGLYASFAMVGVVYGGILQSTRSIMGVFIAALLTKLGYTHIEDLQSRGMFIRRLVAAILMTLAVILWATAH